MKKLISAVLSASVLIGTFSGAGIKSSASESGTAGSADPSYVCVTALQTDHLSEPMGIDGTAPLFSWKIEDRKTRGQIQTAYRVTVAAGEEALAAGNYVWDSTLVESDETVDIPYAGEALAPSTRYAWQVEIRDKDGKAAFSDVAWFETGLMDSGWSGAEWIARSEPKSDGYFELTDFTIDFDYTLVSSAASLLFGGTGDGDFYMWQISAFDWHGDLRLRPHKCESGKFSELAGASLDADKSSVGQKRHMTVEAAGGVVKTYLDGVLKDTRTLAGLELGYIGFRCASPESFTADNIVIRDGDGNVVLDANFDDGAAMGFEKSAVRDGMLVFDSAKLSGSIFLRKSSVGEQAESAPMLRKSFTTTEGKTVASARLYATAAGLYDAYVNGSRVTDSVLNPGMTAYDDHMLYQTFDVTDLVREGENVVGVYLGHGWFNRALRNFGTTLCFYGKLLVTYDDGTSDVIVTDGSWRFYRYGPILDDDLFNGFKYDATVEQTLDGWNEPGYDDSAWDDAAVIAPDKIMRNGMVPAVIAQNLPLIRPTAELPALSVSEPEEGVYVYDFGQNIAGVVRVKASAPVGTTMKLRHAEMLNRENMQGADGAPGTLYVGNLPRADATDTYVFRGDGGEETFEPFFTYHGFRYLEITGLDEPLPPEKVTALLLMSDLEQTSGFECSNGLVNRLYLNALWGARDNFMSVPTDCPQRGERFGWTGDAQIFARTGAYLMDVNAFYQKYCMDMRDTSTDNRIIADVSPASVGNGWYGQGERKGATNGWGDAIIIIPYQMYKQYGNKAVLTENYQTMRNWMEYLVSTSTDYIRDQSWTGDWLPVNEPKSPIALTDTAFCAYSASLLAEISDILGETEAAQEYRTLYENYRAAWREKFLVGGTGGKTVCGTQTSYVLGLKFGLFDEEETAQAAQNLVANIKAQGWHLTTGFLGLSYLNPVLSEYGYSEVAYRLLEQEEYPSWLYSVTTGATTIWESWYAFRQYEDGSSKATAESLNHFSYGSVVEWLYRTVLGIERDDADDGAVGFKHFLLKPQFGGTLTYANGSYNSVRGVIESGWTLDRKTGAFTYSAVVPANTSATLFLPVASADTAVAESGMPASEADGVTAVGYRDGCMLYELQSGSYAFETTVNPDMNAVTTIRVENSAGIAAELTADGEIHTAFPAQVFSGEPVTLTARSLDGKYTFLRFVLRSEDTAADGTTVDGAAVSGDKDLDMLFAYTGIDDGTDGQKTVTLVGESGVQLSVNGTPARLPYTGRFDKGAEVEIKVLAVPDGYEFDGLDGIDGTADTVYLKPLCDISAAVKLKNERYRAGYDIFFDFTDGIGYWKGMSAAVTYEPGYLRFKATEKTDGTFDPRASYDFTESNGTATGGAYVPAADFESLTIGYIADAVAGDSTPVMYISTKEQPNYVSPVRAKKANEKILTTYADGSTLREVTFTLAGWSAWTGEIKQVYLDILDNVDGNLRVDYIRLKHRDLKLTVKKSEVDPGTIYTYRPGSTLDLTALETEEGFLGYSLVPGSEEYITSLILTADTVIYANGGEALLPVMRWDFEDGSSEGWNLQGGFADSVADGAFKVSFAAADAKKDVWLYKQGLNADASVYRYVVFKMRHNLPDGAFGAKPAEVFFRRTGDGWGQHLSQSIEQKPASDAYECYIVDMSECAHWNGTVDTLRIDPFETVAPTDGAYAFEMDEILLAPAVTLTYHGGYEGAATTTDVVPAHVPVRLAQVPAPEREGYDFIGWSDGGSAVPLTGFTPTGDTVLYALWEKKTDIVWDFEDGSDGGWKLTNAAGGITDGVMKAAFSVTNADAWLYNTSLNLDASVMRYLVLELRHNIPDGAFGTKPFEVFFTRTTDSPWQQHLSVHVPQRSAEEGFDTYVIDMKTCAHWNGTVNRLRIDPFEVKSPSEGAYAFEVDSIRVCAAATLTLDGGYEGAVKAAYDVPAGMTVQLAEYPVPERAGYVFTGWSDGTSALPVQTVSVKESATLCATWVPSEAPLFAAEKGTSIRVKAPAGIRFRAAISNGARVSAALVEYGFLAALSETLAGGELSFAFDGGSAGGAKPFVSAAAYNRETGVDTIYDLTDTYAVVTAVLVGIPESEYNTPLCVRSYAKYTDAFGGTFTVYGNTVQASLAGAAYAIVNDASFEADYTDEEKAYLRKVAAAYEPA